MHQVETFKNEMHNDINLTNYKEYKELNRTFELEYDSALIEYMNQCDHFKKSIETMMVQHQKMCSQQMKLKSIYDSMLVKKTALRIINR